MGGGGGGGNGHFLEPHIFLLGKVPTDVKPIATCASKFAN